MTALSSFGRTSLRALFAGAATAAVLAPSAFAQSVAVGSDAVIEEVVVTASRREERLQDVPATVSAFSAAKLEAQNVQSTKDLTRITPGVFMTQSGVAQQPTIRGVGLRGPGAGDESVVPLFVDGVYQPFVTTGAQDFNNIERIEILKGPQSALYGRNATGGAINIITRRPSREFGGAASLSYGSYNEVVAKAYVTGPLLENVQADLAMVYRKDDGYFTNIVDGSDRGGTELFSFRAQVAVEPTSNSEVRLAYMHINGYSNAGAQFAPIDGNTIGRRFVPTTPLPTRPYEVAALVEPYTKPILDAVSIVGTLHLSGIDLHSVTGGSYGVVKVYSDSDGSQVEAADQNYRNVRRSLYQEVYAQNTTEGPLQWIAGFVYFHDVAPSDFSIFRNKNLTTGVIVVTPQAYTAQDTDSYAVYGQGTYSFTEHLNLIVGGRYTKEERTYRSLSATNVYSTGTAKFSKFTPTATLQYKFNSDLQVYAKAGQAFKSGVFNGVGTNQAFVRPEKLTQYEIGVKARITSRIQTSLAAYHSDYENIQASARDAVTGISFLQNAAGGEIEGVEAEVNARVADNFTVFGGMSLIRAHYTSFPGAVVTVPTCVPAYPAVPVTCAGGNTSIFADASGKKLIRVPFRTFNLGGNYIVESVLGGDLNITANAYYQGKNYRDALNRIVEPSSTQVDASVAWTPDSKAFTVTLWGRNLLDQLTDIQALTSGSGDLRSYAPPRTVGIRISADF